MADRKPKERALPKQDTRLGEELRQGQKHIHRTLISQATQTTKKIEENAAYSNGGYSNSFMDDADPVPGSVHWHRVGVYTRTIRIVDLHVIAGGALTASDSNYARIILYRWDGTLHHEVGYLTTQTTGSGGTGDWSAGDTFKISDFSGVDTDNDVHVYEPGQVVVIKADKIGSGVALPMLHYLWEYTYAS